MRCTQGDSTTLRHSPSTVSVAAVTALLRVAALLRIPSLLRVAALLRVTALLAVSALLAAVSALLAISALLLLDIAALLLLPIAAALLHHRSLVHARENCAFRIIVVQAPLIAVGEHALLPPIERIPRAATSGAPQRRR